MVTGDKWKHKCPVCGRYEFQVYNSYDICEVCGWEDCAVQEEEPDYAGGVNALSLNDAKRQYQGINVERKVLTYA